MSDTQTLRNTIEMRRLPASDALDFVLEQYEMLERENGLVRELDVLWNGASGAAKQASLCDMLSQIDEELPALRKDAERLDWLEAWHDCSDMTGYRYKGMGIELVTRGSDGWHFEWDFKPENSTDYDTLREIIDAAKEEGK